MDDIPESLKEALKDLSDEDAREALKTYLEASKEDQLDMLAFLEGDNREFINELKLKEEEGIPTSRDLDKWIS